MRLSRYLLIPTATVLFSCGGKGYNEVLMLRGKGYEVRLLSSDGRIDVGINRIRVEVKPHKDLEELYFYMPPMPGMPEMRAIADLKAKGRGIYEGKVSISMEGSWQVIAKVGGEILKTEINVPFEASGKSHEGMGHSSTKHDMGAMKPDMEGEGKHITVPNVKFAHFNVATFRVDSAEVPLTVRAAGIIKFAPKGIYEVSPRFSGYITRVFVDREGRRIAKGTPLFEFYSPEILRAFGEYEGAKRSGDSLSMRLAEEKLRLYGVSPEDMRDTTAIFRSPVSGRVARVGVYAGREFKRGESLYGIFVGNVLYFIGGVPQSKARHIRVGDRVSLGEISAEIAEISPKVNERTRTVEFVAVFAGEGFYDGEIRVGEIKRMLKGLFVPLDAVIRTGKEDYVYVRKGKNTFAVKRVKVVSPVDGGYIVEGLDVGDEVVTSGVFFIDAEAHFRGAGGGHAGH